MNSLNHGEAALREPDTAAVSVAVAILAAGQSTRMAGTNKMLATFDSVPLIRRATVAAIEAGGSPVIAVLGYMADQCQSAMKGLDVVVAHNADYASGLATSLQCAIRLVPGTTDGIMVMLADMPAISADHLVTLMRTFREAGGKAVVRATDNRIRGNPVILPRSLFDEALKLAGDVGARDLIDRENILVVEVDLGRAALFDVDTREALHAAGGFVSP